MDLLKRVKEELKITFNEQDARLQHSIDEQKLLIKHMIMSVDEVERGVFDDKLENDLTYNHLIITEVSYGYRKTQDNTERMTALHSLGFAQRVYTLASKVNRWRDADGFK